MRFIHSTFGKVKGLMFSKKQEDVCFVFNKEIREGVHTFFVFYPLHIYFLNKNKEVIDYIYLKPFRSYFPKKKFMYMVESYKKIKKIEW